LKKPQIFLKRTFAEIQVNAYNKHILSMQRAIMDIQLILDPFACCSYIINYINKSQRGISKLMREAAIDIRRGNLSIRQKLGQKFFSGTEIFALEAVCCCLGLALSESSNKCVHVNTFPPEQQVRMLRPSVLQNMPQNSTDIFQKGLLDRYEQRPDSHEGLCLADFAATY